MSDHHHSPLPPPEPDNVPLGPVVFWGLGSFIAVVVVIIALGSYFWIEREREDEVKVVGHNRIGVQLKEADIEAQRRLAPIEKAMQQIAEQSEIK